VRRAEDYAVLGARVVVELHSESHAAKLSTRTWAIARRAARAERLADHRRGRSGGRNAARVGQMDRTNRYHVPEEREIPPPMLGDPGLRGRLMARPGRLCEKVTWCL
jgi:hypothetical protein